MPLPRSNRKTKLLPIVRRLQAAILSSPSAVAKPAEKGGGSDSEKSVEEQPKEESTATQAVPKQSPQAKVHPLRYVSLGSLDPRGDSRALVTLTSLGASIERLELNNPRYRDMVDTSGYLGHLVGKEVPEGYEVGYLGRGTPADQAGLQRKRYHCRGRRSPGSTAGRSEPSASRDESWPATATCHLTRWPTQQGRSM